MLLHKSDRPFSDDAYISELKLDGIRIILTKIDDKVKIYTRHNNDVTSKFPELVALNVPNGTILDGELIVTDSQGKPNFESAMERFMSSKSEHSVSFCVFDIICFKGKRIDHLTLLERKAILNEVIPEDTPMLNKVQWIKGNGELYFDLVKQQQLEGIVIKRAESQYKVNKRSHDWLKVINYQYRDVLVSGYRKGKFGWVITDDEGKYLGIMELGVPLPDRQKVYNMKRLEETDKYAYIEPFKINVKFREYTSSGLLRLPSLV